MPGPLFRDDFVGQENGFFRGKGARPVQGFGLYLRIGAAQPQLIPPARRLRWWGIRARGFGPAHAARRLTLADPTRRTELSPSPLPRSQHSRQCRLGECAALETTLAWLRGFHAGWVFPYGHLPRDDRARNAGHEPPPQLVALEWLTFSELGGAQFRTSASAHALAPINRHISPQRPGSPAGFPESGGAVSQNSSHVAMMGSILEEGGRLDEHAHPDNTRVGLLTLFGLLVSACESPNQTRPTIRPSAPWARDLNEPPPRRELANEAVQGIKADLNAARERASR